MLLLQIREEARSGQLEAAERDADAALKNLQNRDAEWAARFRVQKAHIVMLRGRYSESLQLLNDPLPASLARSDTAVQRKMLQALDYSYLQQFDLSDRALSEAEDMATSIQSSFFGDVAQARGILEMERKNYARAVVAYRTAAAFARKRNLARAELNALASLGNVAMWQEHYDEALDRFKAALGRSRDLGAAAIEATTLGNLGWNYSAVGDFENAESFLKEAQEKSARTGQSNERIRWLNMLAIVYSQEHSYPEANSTEEEALKLAENQEDKRTLTACQNTMSEIMLATGHLDDAEKFNREAIKNAGSDQFWVTSLRLIAGRIEEAKGLYKSAELKFGEILSDPMAETPLKWEAHARLGEVFAGEHQADKAKHEFDVAVGTFRAALDSIVPDELRISFLNTAIEFYDAYVNFLIEQKRPVDALKIADLSRAQTLERGLATSANDGTNATTSRATGGKPKGLAQTTAFRPQDSARRLNATLLFYWLGEEKSHLWVITGKGISLFPLPGRAEIDATVKSYLDTFTLPKDPLETGNADAQKLYATLVQPAEKLIPKNSRVIVLPDRGLYSLNFETLIVPGPKPHYWIEDVTLTTANSLSLLSRTAQSAPAKTTGLFLMGDALSASPDFPPLPQAGKEVGLVQNYFPKDGRTVLTGAQATASHFLSGKPETFSYLHFATHGTASTAHPLESAVILSPEGDSYKLYARDIVQHPLHAYLVTISACNGSGLRTYAGEGLVGLAWAFLRAGGHNVIAGLWEVSNASTPQLMDELYKGLHAGKDPASALRDAKLTLVHSNGNYRRPFYWAPFQLYTGS